MVRRTYERASVHVIWRICFFAPVLRSLDLDLLALLLVESTCMLLTLRINRIIESMFARRSGYTVPVDM